MCMVELVYRASSGQSRFHGSTILMSEEAFMLFFDGQCTFTIILILLTQTKAEIFSMYILQKWKFFSSNFCFLINSSHQTQQDLDSLCVAD